MTFQEWFNSAPHRKKYSSDHPAYLAAQESWDAAHEACAQVCEELSSYMVVRSEWAAQQCAKAIRARGENK